jgi:hypothetical protein
MWYGMSFEPKGIEPLVWISTYLKKKQKKTNG